MKNYRDRKFKANMTDAFGGYYANKISDIRTDLILEDIVKNLTVSYKDGNLSINENIKGTYRDKFINDLQVLSSKGNLIYVPRDTFKYIDEATSSWSELKYDNINGWLRLDDVKEYLKNRREDESLNIVKSVTNKSIHMNELEDLLEDSGLDPGKVMADFNRVYFGVEKHLSFFQRIKVLGYNSYEDFKSRMFPDAEINHITSQSVADTALENGEISEGSHYILKNSYLGLQMNANNDVHLNYSHQGNWKNSIFGDAQEGYEDVVNKYKVLFERMEDRIDFVQDILYGFPFYMIFDLVSDRKIFSNCSITLRDKTKFLGYSTGKNLGILTTGQILEKGEFLLLDELFESDIITESLKQGLSELIDDNPFINLRIIRGVVSGVSKYNSSKNLKEAGAIVVEGISDSTLIGTGTYLLGLCEIPGGIAVVSILIAKQIAQVGINAYNDNKYQEIWSDFMYQQALKILEK